MIKISERKNKNHKDIKSKKNNYSIPLDYYGQTQKVSDSELIVNDVLINNKADYTIDLTKIKNKREKEKKLKAEIKKKSNKKNNMKAKDTIHREYESHEREVKEGFF